MGIFPVSLFQVDYRSYLNCDVYFEYGVHCGKSL